jgi:diguanylate cyclase (GGDEF)-like protein
MSSAVGAPGGIERRAFRGLSLVPQALPARALKAAIDDAVTVRLVQDVFIECSNRRQLVGLLDRQVAVSQQVKRPVFLMLVELTEVKSVRPAHANSNSPIYDEAVLNVVARIFKASLRPGDFIVRPGPKTLGIMLLDADASGASSVGIRLNAAISRRLSFGKGAVEIRAKFGMSEQFDGFGSAGTSLLATAEMALEKAKANDLTFAVAEPVSGPQNRSIPLPRIINMDPGDN